MVIKAHRRCLQGEDDQHVIHVGDGGVCEPTGARQQLPHHATPCETCGGRVRGLLQEAGSVSAPPRRLCAVLDGAVNHGTDAPNAVHSLSPDFQSIACTRTTSPTSTSWPNFCSMARRLHSSTGAAGAPWPAADAEAAGEEGAAPAARGEAPSLGAVSAAGAAVPLSAGLASFWRKCEGRHPSGVDASSSSSSWSSTRT
jgi:hypothetical protein